tara:strand:+ start:1595 stop:1984 length:390 start_codon:yes stop_codon:yes gene_type:complete
MSATKNITVVVPDKTVTVSGENYTIDSWPFDDSKIWAIQWDGSTQTGDVEPNPPGEHKSLKAADYDAHIKPYITEWDKAKAAAAVAEEEAKAQHKTEQARRLAARKAGEALGKLPRMPADLYVDRGPTD